MMNLFHLFNYIFIVSRKNLLHFVHNIQQITIQYELNHWNDLINCESNFAIKILNTAKKKKLQFYSGHK